MSSFRAVVLLIGFVFPQVGALSSPAPDVVPKQYIQITNPLDIKAEDKLPTSFIRGWPTWVLDMDGQMTKIPDDDGFVPPDSVDELYQPVDLKRPTMRLALGVHVRSGNIRHIMPALDICYGGGLHRNRGMCSVPRACSWIDFNLAMLNEWKNFQLTVASKGKDEKEYIPLGQIITGKPISEAVERLIMSMAESAPKEMGEGSHVIHVLLDVDTDEDMILPKSGSSLRVTMDDDDHLIDSDDASGMLEVAIQTTMAGSESQYLPDAYKPLYKDASFRNPRYEEFKQRR